MTNEQSGTQTFNPAKQRSRFFGIKIIKTKFQFKFSFIIFLFLSFAASFMWMQGRWTVDQLIQSGMVTDQDTIVLLSDINTMVAQTGMVAIAIVFGLSLLFSFLIAGPIYRFEKTLEAMRDGDLTGHVKLRQFDEFKEVAELFSQALASLRVKIKLERDHVDQKMDRADKIITKLKAAGQTTEAEELAQIVGEIRQSERQIKI